MAAITKPADINKIWSASGDILAPSDAKISQGWSVEIPPRQYFNYIDGKQDQAIAHINQYGIAVWDPVTQYQANASYTQGSDGIVYKALVTNTNINPVGTTGTWAVAFSGASKSSTAQAQAQTDDTTFITPLKLLQAFQGTNQNLSTSGYQKLPGGLIIQWGLLAAPANVSTYPLDSVFPIQFPTQCFSLVHSVGIQNTNYDANATYRTNTQSVSLGIPTTTGFQGQLFVNTNVADRREFRWWAVGK